MRDTVPTQAPIVRNQYAEIRELFNRHVVPSYGRFELALTRGQGSYVWDVGGRRYLDLGSGIAVCSLGHCHPAITEALLEQSQRLVHTSNLYYHEPQGRLAERIVRHLAPGKVFFSNSGAEANEGLYKLARKFGNSEGRYEILTANHSFHGRTLAGIAATGQAKVKAGFEPAVPGFRQVPYDDLQAMRDAISPVTAGILIEGIQGEGGITPASPGYLRGLRKLCDEKRILLMMDAVQCGHFRSGRYQSFQRILGDTPEGLGDFLPDAVSMAKSMGGGFPMGAFWVREEAHGVRLCDVLSPGTHASTFGGTPLGCAVGLKVFDVIEEEGLERHVRDLGDAIRTQLEGMATRYPDVVRSVRGLGFMMGLELQPRENIPSMARHEKAASLQFVQKAQEAGVLLIPSGQQVLRLLPPLNLSQAQADEGLNAIEHVVRDFANGAA